MSDAVDVSRAFLLPEVTPPADAALLSLALFWEQVVLPDYVERSHGADCSVALSPIAQRLRQEGVLVVADRKVNLDRLMPFAPDGGLEGGLTLRVDDDLSHQLQLSAAARNSPIGLPGLLADDQGVPSRVDLSDADLGRVVASHVTRHFLARVDDARSFAEQEHFAPVASSRLSHVAMLLGRPSTAEPVEPAALLTVAASSFCVRAGTSAEDVLRFRESTVASRAAFRRGIAELAVGLGAGDDPNRTMGRARDRYNNNVRPTLAELEEAVGANRAQFLVRSLLHVSAVSLVPVTPTRAVSDGAKFVTETINYRFSRRRLVAEHPYGYLHEVASRLGADGRDRLPAFLGDDGDGEAALRTLVLNEGIRALAQRFLTDRHHE